MTRAREAVLAAIGGACDQATVYRALHYLEESGRAESFVLHCSEHGVERYYAPAASAHRHWFHCESCHRFLDLGSCRLGPMLGEVEAETGVRVMRHTLYMTGLCPACVRKR